jgi:hypothetical protein
VDSSSLSAIDRTVPKELKVAFLSKRFRTFNKVSHHKPGGSPPPQFLADKVPTPSWWKGGEVLAVFDKIMLDKVSCRSRLSQQKELTL